MVYQKPDKPEELLPAQRRRGKGGSKASGAALVRYFTNVVVLVSIVNVYIII